MALFKSRKYMNNQLGLMYFRRQIVMMLISISCLMLIPFYNANIRFSAAHNITYPNSTCLVEAKICLSNPKVSKAVTAKPLTKTTLASATPSLKCVDLQKANQLSITQLSLSNLAKTNALVDTVRTGAAASGESYQDFDQAVNSLIANYNNDIMQSYNNLNNQLTECSLSLQPPLTFQPFTP